MTIQSIMGVTERDVVVLPLTSPVTKYAVIIRLWASARGKGIGLPDFLWLSHWAREPQSPSTSSTYQNLEIAYNPEYCL